MKRHKHTHKDGPAVDLSVDPADGQSPAGEQADSKPPRKNVKKIAMGLVVTIIAAAALVYLKAGPPVGRKPAPAKSPTQITTALTDAQRWEIEKNINNSIHLVLSYNEKNASKRFKKFFDNYADPEQKELIWQLLSDRLKKNEGSGIRQYFEEDEIVILNNKHQALVKGSIIKIFNREITAPKIIYLNIIYRFVDDKFSIYSVNTLNADDYDELIEKDVNIKS